MALTHRAARQGDTFVVDAEVLPQTLDVVRTRAHPLGLRVVTHDLDEPLPDGDIFGVLLQYPGASGRVRDLAPIVSAAHERGALVAVAADLLALTLLTPPGELGADIAVGSSQRFGVPLGFGGPHAGYMSIRSGLERQLPGRLVGVSVDADGEPAYRLALQTREQHIRREKATSNICTAQVLLAVIARMYAVYHGPEGCAGSRSGCTAWPRSWRRAFERTVSRSRASRSSTPSPSRFRALRPMWSRRRWSRASICGWSTRTPSASPATRQPIAIISSRSGARSAWPSAITTSIASTRAPPTRCRPSGAPVRT